MKTLSSFILSLIFPFLAMAQAENYQSAKLKTLDERTVDLGEIFQEHELTLFYFFNEGSRNLTDQFDYLENLAVEYSDIKLKIIAIYNASNTSSYGQIKPLIRGYDISIETLIDVNGEFQRAMGLPVNTTVILLRQPNPVTDGYVQSVSYSPEQAYAELTQVVDNYRPHKLTILE